MGRSEIVRTFIAVDIDEPNLLKKISEVQDSVRKAGAVVKHVEPENLHITFWFLGEVSRGRLEDVLDGVRKVSFPMFDLRLKGLGYFPGGSRVNVVWMGAQDEGKFMNSIYDQLKDVLIPLGFKEDEKGFKPHLTICRVKNVMNKASLITMIERMKEEEFGTQKVRSLKVKKSTLTPSGPIYKDLIEVPAKE